MMDNNILSIAREAHAARNRLGLSQSDAANLIGQAVSETPLHQTYISNIESGRKVPSVQTLVAMCTVYGVDPNTMLGWEAA